MKEETPINVFIIEKLFSYLLITPSVHHYDGYINN